MGARILSLPLILLLAVIFSVTMFIPALHALLAEDHSVARSFLYAGLLGLLFVTIVSLAINTRPLKEKSDLDNLVSLFLAYTVLPLFLALPFYEGLQTTSFINSYVEMVSALTTTGAPLFAPDRLTDSLHLWRGLVGWLGGFLIWVAAAAVLAPMNLGGFEVTTRAEPGQGAERLDRFRRASSDRRIARTGAQLLPVYAGLTAGLWLFLVICNEEPTVAAIHAMSVLATSGISPLDGVEAGSSGLGGEMLMFLFMLFGLSRLTFSKDTAASTKSDLLYDPEFRIGIILVLTVPLLLFSRHWLGAFDVNEQENIGRAIHALWGGMFTVLSFLTTTGFESAFWSDAQNWSGLGTPGLIVLGLSMVGGGVATTAGGVKLLRVYALYLNGRREMERLIHPSSIGGAGPTTRRIRRQGAFIAWIFFMLFGLSLALVSVVLAGLGIEFETAVVMAISALSTTGPLLITAMETPVAVLEEGSWAKLVFCAAMLLGRLETLAIIALFNTALWRR